MEGHHGRVINVASLAAQLVQLPTVNPPGRERLASDLLAPLLADAGLQVTRVGVDGDRETLIAVLPGADPAARARIFTGHLDVVPVPDAERLRWASEPFSGEVRDGRLHGRGSADMKGGVSAFVCAALDLARSGRTPPADVILVLTADEEDLMLGSKAVAGHPLLDRDADVVVCEPTSLRLCTAGRGRTWARITLSGTTAHGSDASAPNPIQTAARLIDALAAEDLTASPLGWTGSPERGDQKAGTPHPTDRGTVTADPNDLSAEPSGNPEDRALRPPSGTRPESATGTAVSTGEPGAHRPTGGPSFWRPLAIAAGAEPCVVPDSCTLTVDARLTPDHDPDDVWRRLSAILDRLALAADVDIVDRREGWRTPPTSRLISDALSALDAEGLDPRTGVFAGTTDGTVLRRAGRGHGVRDVIILGPGDLAAAHAANESVALADLAAAQRLYARLMVG